VKRFDLLPYLLLNMVSGPFHPDLILNMDESGFTQRLLKGTQKNSVFLGMVEIKPRFLAVHDANHVAFVGTVALSGCSLVPLFISTRLTLPSEIAVSHLAGEFRYFRTAKGYLTAEAMDDWIDGVLMPDVAGVRAISNHITECSSRIPRFRDLHRRASESLASDGFLFLLIRPNALHSRSSPTEMLWSQ
jgi:hypothetical protein